MAYGIYCRVIAAITFACTIALATACSWCADAPAASGQLVSIESKGMFVPACTLPGETRADDVAPGHGSCVRASKNRWIIAYQTRSWRGVDDERSIIYQIRKDAPDGPVVKEGFLAQSINDWDPFNDGSKYVRQHGHPVIFGVPKGALIDGKPAPNANLFVAKWRIVAIGYDPARKQIQRDKNGLRDKSQGVQWMQFRLNDAEDDIVIAQPVKPFRQKGFETGPAVCSIKPSCMNQTFVPTVAFNHACTEWADVNHFTDNGQIAPMKITFNAGTGLYEFTECGPLTGGPGQHLMEASLARLGDRWIVAARSGGSSWAVTDDPFKHLPTLTAYEDVHLNSPLTVFTCADGVVRLFCGDLQASPYHYSRNPMYIFDVNVKGDHFTFENRRELFDTFKAGLKFRKEVWPRIDFATLFPPFGKTQIVAYRVAPRAYNFPYDTRKGIPALNADEKPYCGMYYSVLTYRDVLPVPWTFAGEK